MPSLYATVEAVAQALAAKSSAYDFDDLYRATANGSLAVDNLVRRTAGAFRPLRAVRYYDWPSRQTSAYYKLWLDACPLLSLESLMAGGLILPSANLNLEPQRYGPPYTKIEINRGTSSAFSYASGTPQRAIAVTGLWGMGDDRKVSGALVGSINSASTVAVCSNGGLIGVGDHLVIDSERIEVTGKDWAVTGQTIGSDMSSSVSANTLPISTSSVYAGETVIVDSERMKVVDVTASTVIVKRAVDGSTLASHTTGATVYARRAMTLSRGAQGSTATSHSDAAPIYRHIVPADVESLTIAEAIVTHLGEQSGYSRGGSGQGSNAVGAPGPVDAIDQLRNRVVEAYGRQARTRVI